MLIAKIRAIDCVGCAKCLPACPVDAIVGAPQFLHLIVADECIGCGLCVAPCPMDCIEMIADPTPAIRAPKAARAEIARQRYQAKQERLSKMQYSQLAAPQDPQSKIKIRQEIQAAIERVARKS